VTLNDLEGQFGYLIHFMDTISL